MIANNYFSDDKELLLLFEKMIPWEEIVLATEGESFLDHSQYLKSGDELFEMAPSNISEAISLYKDTLHSLGEIFGKEVSANSKVISEKGLQFQKGKVVFPEELTMLYEKIKKSGLLPYAMPRSSGGLGFPFVLSAFYTMIMARSDVSICMAINLLNLAKIVSRYGTQSQIERFAKVAASGNALFAMSLTEPDFGSDLNQVRTSAIRKDDGSYVINGTKRFITQASGLGVYPAFHLVLARVGDKKGARGLSVFLVKSEDCVIAGIEKKLGIHASPTCEVVYENTPAELLGEEGQGLTRCTLGMTSFMRLSSASGGAAGGSASYHESKKYASERIQFGKPIIEIPAVSEMLLKLNRETLGMRLLTLEAAYTVDLHQHKEIRMEKDGKSDREILSDPDIRKWKSISSILTPIAKYYCSESGFDCANTALQIHGGAGYTEDYDVSRIFRDSRINTIYEGTSQIQVRISVGAIIAGMGSKGVFRAYLQSLRESIQSIPESVMIQAKLLDDSIQIFKSMTDEFRKETISENLVILTSRHLICLLFLRFMEKIKDEHDWDEYRNQCNSYIWESNSIIDLCRKKISEWYY